MNANINHDFFIWEENKNIQLQNNNCKQEEKDNCVIITETKTDLIQNAWKNITDPKEREKAYQKAYREANKYKIKTCQKIWYEVNKNKILVQQKSFDESNKEKRKAYLENNKDKIRIQRKSYREVNKDKIKTYSKTNKDKINANNRNRKKVDVQYKLSCNLRSRLNIAISNNQKKGSAVKDMGCTVEELKQYLESKFKPGMTWDNWSIHGWHIDHIKPLASFDLTDRNQLLEACHYTNLQPLWAKDNIIKKDKLI